MPETRSERELLTRLLRDVSRSFYLTLRVLPRAIRRPIGLAYLLARATDTLADTQLVPAAGRLVALAALRDRILDVTTAPLEMEAFAEGQSSAAERELLERVEEALLMLRSLGEFDRAAIQEVLGVIASGQALDLERFAGATKDQIQSLDSEADLDDYTYRVAGCVGEFWTRLCRGHLFPDAVVDDESLLADGVRFGKGLQLVNILRDLPLDLRQGRCYLPGDRLYALNLTPADLLDPGSESRLRPLYNHYLGVAQSHLAAGWRYVDQLPRGCLRVRLACAWPILIGARTLALLREGRCLSPELRIKVTRREVKQILWRTLWAYPRRQAWAALFEQASA
jgi:farnesyl-diphosphate farnesyltransferase